MESDEGVPNLLIDANYIREAILNLMRNAIEAMPEGGNLTVHLKLEDGQVFIQVKDTGVGIEKERQEKLFDLVHTTKINGSGLGLPLVKQIAQLHGGSVHLESEPKNGSTFTLQLPCSQKSKEEASSPTDFELHFTDDAEINTLRVDEKSTAVGSSLARLDLRAKRGVTILTIHRGSETLSNIGGDTELCANDELTLLGPTDKIAEVADLFDDSEEAISRFF